MVVITTILVWSQTHVDIGKSNTVPAITLNILDMINGTVDSGHKKNEDKFHQCIHSMSTKAIHLLSFHQNCYHKENVSK